MATGVEELLDMLFEMIDEAKSMPLSSDKCILERDKALDLLDEIRAQFPMELAEAKKLIAARTEYIASAKREGELIRKQAEDPAEEFPLGLVILFLDSFTRWPWPAQTHPKAP